MLLSSSCQKRKKMFISTQVTSAYTFLTEVSIIHSLNFSYIKLFVAWTDAHKLPELRMAVSRQIFYYLQPGLMLADYMNFTCYSRQI